jgi:hypothetical protein
LEIILGLVNGMDNMKKFMQPKLSYIQNACFPENKLLWGGCRSYFCRQHGCGFDGLDVVWALTNGMLSKLLENEHADFADS